MCYICVGNKLFAFPGRTITASQADVEKATSYLHTLGFSGLTFEDHPADNWIRLKYKDYNKFILDKTFGAGKKVAKRIQWVVPNLGAIYVNEGRKRVLIQNIEKVEKRTPPKPLPPVDTPPYNPNVDKGVWASDQLIDLYKKIQAAGNPRTACHDFMKKIWHYWNQHKFQNQMEEPTLGFLRDMGIQMRKRGLWRHGGINNIRELMISPRLFNARFDVFAEVFLHEMCHQAVSEIDKVRETANKGHGPLWAGWMRKVGLEPKRYDTTDNVEYMTPQERADHEAAIKRREAAKEGLTPKKYNISSIRTQPTPILYVDSTGKRVNGYLFFNPKRPKALSFISDAQFRDGLRSHSWQWININGLPDMFERTEPEDPDYKTVLAALTELITRNIEHQKAKRAVRPRYQWRPY